MDHKELFPWKPADYVSPLPPNTNQEKVSTTRRFAARRKSQDDNTQPPPSKAREIRTADDTVDDTAQDEHATYAKEDDDEIEEDHDDKVPSSSSSTEEDAMTTNSISDDDLLLACRSYLQKKNQLGQWTEFEKRQEHRQQQQRVDASTRAGFFWDDPTELKYYRPPSQMRLHHNTNRDDTMMDDHLDDLDEQEDAIMEGDSTTTARSRSNNNNNNDGDDIIRYTSAAVVAESPIPEPTSKLEQVTFDFRGGLSPEEDRLEQWARHFSTFPAQPSQSQQNRSRAIQRRWDDPEWKARWYQRRWGHKGGKSQSSTPNLPDADANNDDTAQKSSEPTTKPKPSTTDWKQRAKTAALTPDFLTSEVLTRLTEDEIAQAVDMYVQSNQKRVETRQRTQEERRALLRKLPDTTTDRTTAHRVPLNALAWDRDPKALEEARRIRSERAKQTYQTRLDNNHQRSIQRTTKPKSKAKIAPPPTPLGGDSPQEALSRMEWALDQGALPQLHDLELLAGPSKLPKRKQLLLRLFSERLGLRGKCVPVVVENDTDDQEVTTKMQFITSCRVDQLVAFALDRVREASLEDSSS